MRAAEVAAKFKNFSQTSSLEYRIQHVIGVHNDGYLKFYNNLLLDLGIDPKPVFYKFLAFQDERHSRNKFKRSTREAKRKRSRGREAKCNEELLIERTSSIKQRSYGPSIGVIGPNKRAKVGKTREYCVCGGEKPHKNTNSRWCRLNRTD